MNDEVEELEVVVKKIRYKGIVFVPEVEAVDKKVNKETVGNAKKPYVVKWIEKKQVGDVFTKDEFYKEFPKIKKEKVRRRCVDASIEKLILEQRIGVHEIFGQYKVLKL